MSEACKEYIRQHRVAGESLHQCALNAAEQFPLEFEECVDHRQMIERARQALRSTRQFMTVEPVQVVHKEPEHKSVQQSLMDALAKGTTSAALAEQIGVTDKIALAMIEEKKQAGYNVRDINGVWKLPKDIIPSENHFKLDWNGDRTIRFGLCGDTQINSKYTQITHTHKLYDFYASEGIADVYHTGDMDDGEQMRKGHQYELYNQGVDDHLAEIVKVYPRRKISNDQQIITHFITGNHDASMVKLAGVDIGRMIYAERDDMEYLGQDSAVINLTDNCTLELRHPGDGTAYAISYKLQKIIEAMSGGEKPNILAVGHYHKQEQIFHRNVHAFQTACLQAQTPWERSKGISVSLGGWLIELRLNVDGGVERIKTEFFPFYTAIKDDWRNWR
jgi:hypothetical protein